MKQKTIYLDYASTTPVDPRVIDAMMPFFGQKFGNASSVHCYGRDSKVAIESAREWVALLFNAHSSEIIFTSGGTEAINSAIKGVMLQQVVRGKNHIITSKIEHQAVLKCCEYLEENGFQITYLDVDSNASVEVDTLKQVITDRTCLITIMHANNEIGLINPIQKIAAIAHEHDIIFLSDTTQSAGKIRLNYQTDGFDLAVCSAHKIYGPKGIGALYVKRGIDLDQLIHGGPQERGRRGGTENVPLIVGFGKAAEIALSEHEQWQDHILKLRKILSEKIREISPNIRFNGIDAQCIPNILSISFDSNYFEISGEALLMNMDLAGVAVSSGSACTSGSIEPSHVLLAMGYDQKTADATLRFSFGKDTQVEEVLFTADILKNIVLRHQKN